MPIIFIFLILWRLVMLPVLNCYFMDIQISLKVFMTLDSQKPCFERIINCDSNFDYVGVTSTMFALFGSKSKIIYEVVL